MSYGNADSITQEELKVHTYFLSSDPLEGRNLPSRGYDVAALYIASQLAQWGLKPGGSTTNTDGPLQPYFMPMELAARQVVPAESKATITAPAAAGRGGRGGAAAPRSTDFEYGKDWTVTAGRGSTLAPLQVTANLVFAGNGYVINKTNVNPYQGLDVKDKIVVVAGLPPELASQQAAVEGGRGGGGGRGAAAQNPLGTACTDFLTPEQAAAKNGALAVLTIASFQQLNAMSNPAAAGGRGPSLNGPAYQPVKLQTPAACPSVPNVVAGLAMTNAIFQGEKSSGSQVFYAAGANANQVPFELNAAKKLTLDLKIRTDATHAQNVVAIVEGADPVLKNEYVVISAHLDHIGFSAPQADGDRINNGADDDASGCAGLLAMARSFSEGAAKGMRPKRSIVFLWNAGEEKGLWGSQLFMRYPFIEPAKVVTSLNMDMIGRTKGPGFTDPDRTHVLVNPGEVLLVGPNVSSSDLSDTIESVNSNYQKMVFNHFYDTTAPDETHDNLGPQPNGQRIFYRSDHYNFAKMGIPIAFFTTGLHPDYHRPGDTADKIDYKQMQMVSKTVAAVTWVLANQPGRPKLKDKLPEQLTRDMKAAQDQGWGKVAPVPAPLPGMPK